MPYALLSLETAFKGVDDTEMACSLLGRTRVALATLAGKNDVTDMVYSLISFFSVLCGDIECTLLSSIS